MAKEWGTLKKPKGPGGNKDIQRIKYGETTRVRFIGDVLPRYVYWVTNNEGKRVPQECISFDRETEQFSTSTADPFHEISSDLYDENPAFSYVTNVIDRADGEIKLMDLKLTVYRQIVDLATNPEYGNPADEENGYDITIKKEKTGPLPQNVKYSVTPGRSNTPLTDEEKAMDLFDLDVIFKKPEYDTQKQWLLKNTLYFSDNENLELNSTETMQDI